jgi:hypothetical protein
MRMLFFLESLLLCDKNNINAEGQRSRGAEENEFISNTNIMIELLIIILV